MRPFPAFRSKLVPSAPSGAKTVPAHTASQYRTWNRKRVGWYHPIPIPTGTSNRRSSSLSLLAKPGRAIPWVSTQRCRVFRYIEKLSSAQSLRLCLEIDSKHPEINCKQQVRRYKACGDFGLEPLISQPTWQFRTPSAKYDIRLIVPYATSVPGIA
eukprot:2659283-Rhodomonas_salina.2